MVGTKIIKLKKQWQASLLVYHFDETLWAIIEMILAYQLLSNQVPQIYFLQGGGGGKRVFIFFKGLLGFFFSPITSWRE